MREGRTSTNFGKEQMAEADDEHKYGLLDLVVLVVRWRLDQVRNFKKRRYFAYAQIFLQDNGKPGKMLEVTQGPDCSALQWLPMTMKAAQPTKILLDMSCTIGM